MYRYEILTEDKNRDFIEKTVNKYFSGYTLRKQIGYWQGTPEKSLSIIILAENKIEQEVISIVCNEIKVYNNQDSVIYTVDKTIVFNI